jgi:hypothetical protein
MQQVNEIVSNVEVAEAILENVVSQFKLRIGLGHDVHSEAAAARGAAEQGYPEIWHRLDAAREGAKRAGLDVSRYDALRPARLALDDAGVQAARHAIRVFRAANPHLPWSAPTSQAVPNVRNGTTIATLLIVAFVIGLLLLRDL